MNQNEEIRVLYVQPGKYPEEIKIPNTLETFQKYVCGSIESVRLDRDAYIICNDEGSCFHYHRTAYMVQRISSQVRF